MKRLILTAAIVGALTACAPMKPADCEKASTLADCKYPAAAAPAPKESGAPDCDGMTYEKRPLYPVREHATRKSGNVNVSFDVKPNGRATNYRQTGDAAFFGEAWRAVSRSCWTPGQRRYYVYVWDITKGAEAFEDLLGDLSSGKNAPKMTQEYKQ
ncbi:TPA: energy transducer TonB [Salmonella enterica subsp. enterica serovar Virchow]